MFKIPFINNIKNLALEYIDYYILPSLGTEKKYNTAKQNKQLEFLWLIFDLLAKKQRVEILKMLIPQKFTEMKVSFIQICMLKSPEDIK